MYHLTQEVATAADRVQTSRFGNGEASRDRPARRRSIFSIPKRPDAVSARWNQDRRAKEPDEGEWLLRRLLPRFLVTAIQA